jgi:VWFA-related protein
MRAGAAIACVCALAIGQLSFVESASSPVRITFPADGALVTGPVTLQAEVDPSVTVTGAVFFVDGREVCTIAVLPIRCEWDAGPAIVAHHVRLVVHLAAGGRVVRTVRTAAIAYAETVDVDAVQVSVTVTDEHGQYVKGLPRSAFHVSENGRPQPISHFYAQDAPLELVVAVDVSASMSAAMPAMKQAVAGLLAVVPRSHRVTLLAFNDEVFTIAPGVSDPAERAQVIDKLTAWGATALYESILRGVQILGARPGRKALLVFTDGEDRGSQATIEEVEQALQSNDLALYMIGQGHGLTHQPLKKLMERLARPTGGRAISTVRIEQLQESFADVFEEMSNQYVIAYSPTNEARDGSWREIAVTVDGYDRIRARQGYRAARRD